MDRWTRQILLELETRVDEIALAIATCTAAEVPGFGPIRDDQLIAEVVGLSRRHLLAFILAMRNERRTDPEARLAARERAAQRAREMVPLSAIIHSYLIAQRELCIAIARAAGPDRRSRAAALALTAHTCDIIGILSQITEAYLEARQNDLADLGAGRYSLLDALLTEHPAQRSVLTRHAIGVGFDPAHAYVAVVAQVDLALDCGGEINPLRWVGQAIARNSGRPERDTFIVVRDQEVVALLDASGPHNAPSVLHAAATAIRQSRNAVLRAGTGPAFVGLAGFADSFRQARRAVRQTRATRPFVFGPHEIRLFDEFAAAIIGERGLIPDEMRQALADESVRGTLEALMNADMNVGVAARVLSLHPNSLRYRLRRIANKTGRNPLNVADLLDLVTASRAASSRRNSASPA